jgi:hypothetical protein
MSRHYGYAATERTWNVCASAGRRARATYYSSLLLVSRDHSCSIQNRVLSMFYNNQLRVTETEMTGKVRSRRPRSRKHNKGPPKMPREDESSEKRNIKSKRREGVLWLFFGIYKAPQRTRE